jgi:hypothetical protein
VLSAVAAAVAAGAIWLTSGPASVWGEQPPAGVVSKAAVLRAPPEEVSVSALTPEALPDAWTDSKATAASILDALSAQRGVPALPWRLIERAIGGALHSGFLRALPGAVTWPCQPHEAGALGLALPEVETPPVDDDGKPKTPGLREKPQLPIVHAIREAVLDSNDMAELADAMADILAAAGSLTLRFRVTVECAEGEHPSPQIAKAVVDVLERISDRFSQTDAPIAA